MLRTIVTTAGLAAAAAVIMAASAHADGLSGQPGQTVTGGTVSVAAPRPAATNPLAQIANNWATTISNIPGNYAALPGKTVANWSAILTGRPVPYPGSGTPGGDSTSVGYGPTSLQRSQQDASRLQNAANNGTTP